jgi:hypothetical protein
VNPYYFLFYLLYRLCSFADSEKGSEVGAVIMMGLVTYIMLIASVACLEPVTHIVTNIPKMSVGVGAVVMTLMAVPHYLLIVRNGKYQKIIQRIESQTRKQRALQLLLVLVCTSASPILFAILVSLDIVHRN